MTKQSKFSLAYKDPELDALVARADQKTLAVWAIECAEHVMPYFEERYPHDRRPRSAIETLQKWLQTGAFSMKVIRTASLDAHAAAREVGDDSPARSAARAAGQAVATAHVPAHALAAAKYAVQAVHRAAVVAGDDADAAMAAECDWQRRRLRACMGAAQKS